MSSQLQSSWAKILGFVGVVALAASTALAAPITGVKDIEIIDNDGNWFYLEEVNIFNTAGTDVASLAFGSTGTPVGFPGNSFGSSPTGAIDDLIGNCCGTGMHGNTASSMGQTYLISLPTPQDIDAMSFPIEIFNRQDGCCPERVENLDIRFLDEFGSPIEVEDAMGNPTTTFSLTGSASFDTTFGPGGGTISINGISSQVIPEPTSLAIWTIFGLGFTRGASRQRRS